MLLRPTSIPILVYHQIDKAPAQGVPFRSLCVSPGAFARQMALLRMLGYRGLSMDQLMPYLTGQRQGRVVGITFDDGYLNNLQHALPVLRRHGFSSTCYAVSGLLGQTNVWDASLGIPPAPLMTSAQLRAWIAAGQSVGAHTQHHVHLDAVPDDVAETEIAGSKAELEQQLQSPVAHFCYPYGTYLAKHAALAQQAGFVTATTTQRGRATVGDDPMQLKRVPVLRSTTLLQFAVKVLTPYEDRKGGASKTVPPTVALPDA